MTWLYKTYTWYFCIFSPSFACRILKETVKPVCLSRQNGVASLPNILYGKWNKLPNKVQNYVEENIKLCKPSTVHICDGSDKENELLLYVLQRDGMIKPLPKLENWYVCQCSAVYMYMGPEAVLWYRLIIRWCQTKVSLTLYVRNWFLENLKKICMQSSRWAQFLWPKAHQTLFRPVNFLIFIYKYININSRIWFGPVNQNVHF